MRDGSDGRRLRLVPGLADCPRGRPPRCRRPPRLDDRARPAFRPVEELQPSRRCPVCVLAVAEPGMVRRLHLLRFRDGLPPKRILRLTSSQLTPAVRRRIDLKVLARHFRAHVIVELMPAIGGELLGADLGLRGLKVTPPDASNRRDRFAELWSKFEAIARQVAAEVGMTTISDERALATWQAGIDRSAAILIELGRLHAEEGDRVALVRSSINAFVAAFAEPLGRELRALQAAVRRGEPVDARVRALVREDGIAALLKAAAVLAEREVTASHRTH